MAEYSNGSRRLEQLPFSLLSAPPSSDHGASCPDTQKAERCRLRDGLRKVALTKVVSTRHRPVEPRGARRTTHQAQIYRALKEVVGGARAAASPVLEHLAVKGHGEIGCSDVVPRGDREGGRGEDLGLARAHVGEEPAGLEGHPNIPSSPDVEENIARQVGGSLPENAIRI